MSELDAMSRQPCAKSQPVSLEDFGKIMSTMSAALPKRATDDMSGKTMLAVYHRMLGKYPRAAIAHLAEQALEHCRWFPTVAECRDLLKDWDERHRQRGPGFDARRRIADEMQARLDRDMNALRKGNVTQAQVDAWPERWRMIGATQGYLNADGTLRKFA